MKQIATACAVLLLTACSGAGTIADKARELHGKGIEVAAKGFGELTIVECARSLENRKRSLEALNSYLATQGRTERATALDCNGDGTPDF